METVEKCSGIINSQENEKIEGNNLKKIERNPRSL